MVAKVSIRIAFLLPVAASLLWAAIPPARAESCGKLCAVERDATKPAQKPDGKATTGPTKQASDKSAAKDDSASSEFVGLLSELMWFAIVEGGNHSALRADGSSPTVAPRLEGDALLSVVRLDVTAQQVDRTTNGMDYRLEVGYGPWALQGRLTRYREELLGSPPPIDRLDLRQFHVLYRMAGEWMEIDLGFGTLQIAGLETNGSASLTIPLLIHPSPHYGFEFRPAWATINGNNIRDQEFSLLLGARHLSAKIGYRRFESSVGRGGAVLSGPFAGVSLRY